MGSLFNIDQATPVAVATPVPLEAISTARSSVQSVLNVQNSLQLHEHPLNSLTGVQGLPWRPRLSRVDLRLIRGHLGDEDGQSTALQKYLHNAVPGEPKFLYTLVNVSGSGKTKCMFDVLRHKWGLYLNCNGGWQDRVDESVIALRTAAQERADAGMTPDVIARKLNTDVLMLVTARVMQMLAARMVYSLTPEQWLLCQLSEDFSSGTLVGALRRHLADAPAGTLEELNLAVLDLARHLNDRHWHLPIALDEAQVFAASLPGRFLSRGKDPKVCFSFPPLRGPHALH